MRHDTEPISLKGAGVALMIAMRTVAGDAITLVALAGAALLPACRSRRAPPDAAAPSVQSGDVFPLTSRRGVNVAHRGASGHAPEHTLVAYDMALAMGAGYIEQDLQLTKDGVLVVLHDPTLDRTARGPAEHCTGPVIAKTLAQIRTCDAGTWFNETFPDRARAEYVGLRIPTLEEVFARYGGRTSYYIETKNPEDAPGLEEALLRLLDRFGLRRAAAEQHRVLIQSFRQASLQKMHALDPSLPLIQLFPGGLGVDSLPVLLDRAKGYAIGIGPSKRDVSRTLLDAAHARCLAVHPYTVNETGEMEALIALGVDGMFTDFPDRLERLAGRFPAPPPLARCERRTH